ncbi:MAG: hypothetical protein FWD28_04905 [Treponema sp.]|nr:hypothetical protein [Treponema sp.]
MKSLFIILFLLNVNAFADDAAIARQYLERINIWIQAGDFDQARIALERAADYAHVSSDISYELAVIQERFSVDRTKIIENLDKGIQTNRWVIYNEGLAVLFKARQLIAMRNYHEALNYLDNIMNRSEFAGNAYIRTEIAMQRLLCLRSIGKNDHGALAHFRSEVLSAMDRFPRDPRPLRIFFEYARDINRRPQPSELPSSDVNIMELALHRLPFLLEQDTELAWMAAPFMRDLQAARRLLLSYRNSGNHPSAGSIAPALNLGLLGDIEAADELFASLPGAEDIKIDKNIISEVYNLLRSEEGREYFTRKLLSFTGYILSDDDSDGFIDSRTKYKDGIIEYFELDRRQTNVFDLHITMGDGAPAGALVQIAGQETLAFLFWERYPSAAEVLIGNLPDDKIDEHFKFGPAVFQYAPVVFTTLGGSNRLTGLPYPVPAQQYIEMTRRSLLSFCSSYTRPSPEIDGAMETFFMNRGVILQTVEHLNGRQVSVTEFERGLPVIQHIDLDLDGRMETIRRFRQPPQVSNWEDILNYRSLIASSESDWRGDGRHKTMEVYLEDGSVVYYFDMDGSGEMIRTETRNHRNQ